MDGYDIAGEDDLLRRKRLAKQIFDLIQNTSLQWSIRIGIDGAWGAGKTTVLQYILRHAEDAGYPVITLNPWKFNSLQELKDEFNKKLSDHKQIKAYFTPLKKRIIKKTKALWPPVSIRKLEPSRSVTELLSKFGIGIAKEFISLDEKEIEQIVIGLQNDKKRIIIAIDDLDRTNPKLIPTLLLSLSEILDLPGFSFILPFDRNKVAKALSEDHPSYGTGHEFLEKIIDFPYFLDIPSLEQRRLLFQEQISLLCPFIPIEPLEGCYEYLPDNPRKLKAIVRSLKVLEPEISRHDTSELNWKSLLFVCLLKQASAHFLNLFHQEIVLAGQKIERLINEDEDKSTSGWDWFFFHQKEGKQKRQEQISSMISRVNDIEPEKSSYIQKLIYGWLGGIGMYSLPMLDYTINLLDHPHTVTWKEFDAIYTEWKKTRRLSDINNWIISHAKERHTSTKEVADEFFHTLIVRRKDLLEKASSVLTAKEHQEIMLKAGDCLELTATLFKQGLPEAGDSYFRNATFLRKYLEMMNQWMHFDANEEDKKSREREAILLKEFLQYSLDDFNSICSVLLDFQKENVYFSDKKEKKMCAVLSECMQLISPKKLEETLILFEKKESLSKLHSDYYKGEDREILLNSESNIYKPPYRDRFFDIFQKAPSNLDVHQNCCEFFSLIARNDGTRRRENTKGLIEDKDLIKALWKAVISNKLQFRMLSNLREERQLIIAQGIEEDDLPMPRWLINEKFVPTGLIAIK